MEDKYIVDLYWERDEKAITETAAKYGRYCYSIAFNILSNTEDAEESVNDTYLNAWNSMPPHRPTILSTFIGKVTRFVSLKKWREKRTQKRGGGNIDLAYEELSDCIPADTGIDEELENAMIVREVIGEDYGYIYKSANNYYLNFEDVESFPKVTLGVEHNKGLLESLKRYCDEKNIRFYCDEIENFPLTAAFCGKDDNFEIREFLPEDLLS